jgi:hypothetical protein
MNLILGDFLLEIGIIHTRTHKLDLASQMEEMQYLVIGGSHLIEDGNTGKSKDIIDLAFILTLNVVTSFNTICEA